MTDSNETARATNRAAMVAGAAKYLGPGREKSCQVLGDIMMASIETIAAAAGVKIQLTSDSPDVQQLLDKLGPQIQQHAEKIAHAATHVLVDVYLKTLLVATRAQDLEAEELAALH
jgi:hypothetical protein